MNDQYGQLSLGAFRLLLRCYSTSSLDRATHSLNKQIHFYVEEMFYLSEQARLKYSEILQKTLKTIIKSTICCRCSSQSSSLSGSPITIEDKKAIIGYGLTISCQENFCFGHSLCHIELKSLCLHVTRFVGKDCDLGCAYLIIYVLRKSTVYLVNAMLS